MANVLGGRTICQRMNTAGTNLQNKLNARGVSCTYGKTTDGKLDIDGLADLITSSNLKGANDALISITASRPYLLSGETTDLIVHLTNGLGAPLPNKEVTIENSSSIGGIDEIFTEENWSSGNIGNGVFTIGSSYAYMISEFSDLTHYTLNFHVYDGGNLDADVFFGAATTGSGDGIGIKGNGGFIFIIYKIVDNVETVLGSLNIQSLVQGDDPIPLVVKRDGNTITLNDYSVTSSSLKNTIKAKNCEFYEDELSLVSLYTGITNNEGVLTLYDVSVSANTTFLASYSTFSGSIVIESSDMIDYGVTNNNNFTDWNNASSRLTVTVTSNGKLLESSTNGYGYYITKNYKYTDYIVEFDVVSLTELVAWYCRASSSDVQIVGNLYTIGVRNGDHVKIQVEDNYFNLWTNDVKKTNSPIQITPNGPCDVGFRFTNQTGKNITFKNFRIQEL